MRIRLRPRESSPRFRLSEAFSDAFVRSTRVLPLIHIESSMPLDVVLAGPGLEEQFLDRVVTGQVDDRGVLRMRAASLDVDYIRRTLKMVEDAMGQRTCRDCLNRNSRARTGNARANNNYAFGRPSSRRRKPTSKPRPSCASRAAWTSIPSTRATSLVRNFLTPAASRGVRWPSAGRGMSSHSR